MTDTMTDTMAWSPTEAMDAAFAGHRCELIGADGDAMTLAVHRWTSDPDRADHRLFLNRCFDKTLDVGCGPGRLAGALAGRGIAAMGIDVSSEAVRLAQVRGALALRRDVFADIPGSDLWQHALLADGNVGIGGDPVRLLRRMRDLVRPAGTILAEVEAYGVGLVHDRVRLRVGDQVTDPFDWARVGADAIGEVAAAAGLHVRTLHHLAGRYVATLMHVPEARAGRRAGFPAGISAVVPHVVPHDVPRDDVA